MKLVQSSGFDLQLDASRWIGLDEVDILPGDDAGRNARQQTSQSDHGDYALEESTDGTTRTHVDAEDPQDHMAIHRHGFEIDIVNTNHFAAVYIDDLLVEQIAAEQEHPLRIGEFGPGFGGLAGAHSAVDVLESFALKNGIAFRGVYDEG